MQTVSIHFTVVSALKSEPYTNIHRYIYNFYVNIESNMHAYTSHINTPGGGIHVMTISPELTYHNPTPDKYFKKITTFHL